MFAKFQVNVVSFIVALTALIVLHFHRDVKKFYYAIGYQPSPRSRYYSPRRAWRNTLPQYRSALLAA